MAARGALSKCRLCLKLGDFYSIFAADSQVQLAVMAMACSAVKIQEGDGLPDKVCGECVEKLSAAYIFKQQCERSDAELRKTLMITGIGDTTIHIVDSATPEKLSQRTDKNLRSEKPPLRKSLRENAGKRQYKDLDENSDSPLISYTRQSDLLEERYSVYVPDTKSLEASNLSSAPAAKKRRISEGSEESARQAQHVHNSKLECKICNRKFKTYRSNNSHQRVHKEGYEPPQMTNIEIKKMVSEDEVSNHVEESWEKVPHEREKYTCDGCGKQYFTKVLFVEHRNQCNAEEKLTNVYEKLIQQLTCPICKKRYKKRMYLRKHLGRSECGLSFKQHMQQVSGRRIGSPDGSFTMQDISNEIDRILSKAKHAQCSNCNLKFRSHSTMLKHFLKCVEANEVIKIQCMTCGIDFMNKKTFAKHVKYTHIDKYTPHSLPIENAEVKNDNMLECHKCNKNFENQTKLVMHLAAHMANVDDNSKVTIKRTALPFKCVKCNKKFRYRASLRNHLKVHMSYPELRDEDANKNFKCDVCYKGFLHAKSLAMHKKTAHMIIEGPLEDAPRRGIEYTKCPAKCLHCNIILKNHRETKMHNKIHIENNMKVKNEYTCPGCHVKFTNTKIFRNHIREHNVESESNNEDIVYDASISNFCEVTSELTRDSDQDVDVKPIIDANGEVTNVSIGFSCNICQEKLNSLTDYHQHMGLHANESASDQKLSCFVCHASFRSEVGYRKHMKVHYYDKNINPSLLTCKLCKRPSKNMRSYIAHMSWHSSVGTYRCHVCHETFAYNKHYDTHMKLNHSINISEVSEPTEHQCDMCNKYLDSQKSLDYHIQCHEDGEKGDLHKCPYCNMEFLRKYRLAMHMQTYHNVAIGQNGNFANSSPKVRYENIKIKKLQSICCPICDETFMSQNAMDKHLKKLHPVSKMVKKDDPDDSSVIEESVSSMHPCSVCGKEFPTSVRLKLHAATHDRKSDLFKCVLCFKKSFSMKMHELHLLRTHLLQHHKDLLDCQECDRKFLRRQELRIHLRSAHSIVEDYVTKLDSDGNVANPKTEELEELQCQFCEKILCNEKSYERHLLWHNTRRCNYCGLCFEKKAFLAEHVALGCNKMKLLGNSDHFEKKLKCYMCFKTFSLPIKLSCHLKVQHNVDSIHNSIAAKVHVCDFCFSVFDSEDRMQMHRKSHFPGNSMYCIFCSKCVRPVYFKKHRYSHYGDKFDDKPLQCEDCPETFVNVRSYVSHLKNEHQKTMVWYVPREDPTTECPICHKQFVNVPRHLQHHEKYRCKTCLEYFFSEVLFNEHFCEIESETEGIPIAKIENRELISIEDQSAVVKTEDENYDECDYCLKTYTHQYNKGKHNYNHANILFFGCRLCNKRFSMKSAFNVHAVSHRLQHYKKNPLQCRHCGETFTRLHHYFDHTRLIHKQRETLEYHPKFPPETCLICKKSFNNIHRHYKYHLAFRCKECFKYILSEKYYKNHICYDANEDRSMVVEFDGDIEALINPDFTDYEIEKAEDPIPQVNDNASNFYDENDVEEEYDDSYNNSGEQHSESVQTILPHNITLPRDISIVSTSKRSAPQPVNPPLTIEHLTFGSFSPVISSTVSLYSGVEQEDNNEEEHDGTLEIKSEPIDHYYRDYPSYMDINNEMD